MKEKREKHIKRGKSVRQRLAQRNVNKITSGEYDKKCCKSECKTNTTKDNHNNLLLAKQQQQQ